MYKIFKYIAYALGAIGLILFIRLLFFADLDVIKDSAEMQSSFVTPFLYLGYFTIIFSVIVVAVFVIKGLFKGNIKNTLISIGGFVLIVVIAYLITDGEPVPLDDGGTLSAGVDHWISTGLVIFYILAIAAIGAVFFGGVKKLTTR